MNANQLINEIERAFSGVARPATSLRQFVLTDRFGMSGKITKKQWEQAGRQRGDSNWQDISDAEIHECECLLAHMQAEAFQYYLPAYMRYAVKHLHDQAESAEIVGSVVFSLTPFAKDPSTFASMAEQLQLLNGSHKRVIVQLLNFIATAGYESHAADARAALDGYWSDSGDA